MILISDLADDPPDAEPLTEAVLLLQRLGAQLEIVGLDPTRSNAEYFRRLLGTGALFQEARLPTSAESQGKISLTGSTPTWLFVAAAVTIALLAVDIWWGEPFRWRRRLA